jgi:hypothetical protein
MGVWTAPYELRITRLWCAALRGRLLPIKHRVLHRNVIIMTVAARAEALFASCLQPSDHPACAQIDDAIQVAIRTHGGVCGCAAALAAEYGEHPDTAAERMRWALALAA